MLGHAGRQFPVVAYSLLTTRLAGLAIPLERRSRLWLVLLAFSTTAAIPCQLGVILRVSRWLPCDRHGNVSHNLDRENRLHLLRRGLDDPMIAGEMGRCAAPFQAMRFQNEFSKLVSRLGGVSSLRLRAWGGRSGRCPACKGVVADAVEIVSGMRRLRFACAWGIYGAMLLRMVR